MCLWFVLLSPVPLVTCVSANTLNAYFLHECMPLYKIDG